MILRSLLFLVVVAASISTAGAGKINHDKVQAFAQPVPVTVSEKAAIKFKPSLQIIDGCYPYPAVNAAGETSAGLKGTGKARSKCRGSGLGSQVYGRAMWHNDLWAIMYSWYFPKDIGSGGLLADGQRHKWASAIVWLDNPGLENPKIIAITTFSPTAGYISLKNEPPACDLGVCDPPFTDYLDGTTPLLAYEPYGGNGFHTLQPMTRKGLGQFQDLIMWEQLTEEARRALNETDFGDSVPFIDAEFSDILDAARTFF